MIDDNIVKMSENLKLVENLHANILIYQFLHNLQPFFIRGSKKKKKKKKKKDKLNKMFLCIKSYDKRFRIDIMTNFCNFNSSV